MRTLYPVICSDRLRESRDFYTRLFDLTAVFDDPAFYVLLQSTKDADVQLAFVHREHDSVPARFQQPPQGLLVTIEVPSADALHERATTLGYPIAQALRDEEFGQRHFMTVDPNGLLVDVVQIIPFAPAFAERYGLAGGG
jgi:catechol 2,3-dioxygenase-like lactoylglutathione lyase family enzyme